MISMISQSFSQEIGVRGGSFFSKENKNKTILGYGVFYKINRPSSKLSFVLFADRFKGRNFNNKCYSCVYERYITNFRKTSAGFSVLGKVYNNKFFTINLGPNFTLHEVFMDEKTYYQLSEKYTQLDLEIGLLSTLEYKNFVFQNFNFIIFLNPFYNNILNTSESPPKSPWLVINNFSLNTQIGISYKLP